MGIIIILFTFVLLIFTSDLIKETYKLHCRIKNGKIRENQNYSKNKLDDFIKDGLEYEKRDNGIFIVTKIPEVNLDTQFSHMEFIDEYSNICKNQREYDEQKVIDDRDNKIKSILNP